MQDDTSADVQVNDDDIADVPLFGEPVAAEQTTEAPASTEETPEKGSETEDKLTGEAKTDTEAKTTEATAESDKTEQVTEADADKGKPDPVVAAKAWQERQRSRSAVEQQIDQAYGPKSEQELIDENINKGLSEEEAQREARLQAYEERASFREQRAAIAELNANINSDALTVANDFPVFDKNSPDYDEQFTTMVNGAYATAARVQTDEYGIILSAELPLYDFYKQMADVYTRGASKGATQAQVDVVETLSRVEAIPGGSSSTNKHEETLEEMGERLADLPLI